MSQPGKIPIRLNAAAIMREGALVNQKEDDIDKRLAYFSMGGRDGSDFVKWHQAMKQVRLPYAAKFGCHDLTLIFMDVD